MAESLLLGLFAVWFFIVHRMKVSTIRAKIREMVRESDLGISTYFKNMLLDSFFKGMKRFAGSWVNEKRPIHLHLLVLMFTLVS